MTGVTQAILDTEARLCFNGVMDTASTTTPAPDTYAVWYASAGCLPDSNEPSYVGPEDACMAFIEEQAQLDPEPPGSLYSYSIEPWTEADEDDFHGDHNDASPHECPVCGALLTDHGYCESCDSPPTNSVRLYGAEGWAACADTVVNLTLGALIKLAVEHPTNPVRHYHSDFAHDMRWLIEHLAPGLTFGFCFDDCGTWIYPLDQAESFDKARAVAYRCTLRADYGTRWLESGPVETEADFDTERDRLLLTTPATWHLDITPVEVAK